MTDVKERADVLCDYCQQPAPLCKGAEIKGQQYPERLFYLCKPCDAWVAVDEATLRPLGRFANKPLRKAKNSAHALLDRLTRAIAQKNDVPFGYARNLAIGYLCDNMNLRKRECHVSLFTIEQCEQAMKLCRQYLDGKVTA